MTLTTPYHTSEPQREPQITERFEEFQHTEQNTTTDRRDFLLKAASMLGVTLSAGALTTLVNSCENTTIKSSGITATLNVSNEVALKNVGGAVTKQFGANNGGRNLIIIRSSTTEFLVLTAVCTHTGCDVGLPSSAGAVMVCPCHGSEYSSKDGSRLSGPASGPLQRFASSFNAATNVLTISF